MISVIIVNYNRKELLQKCLDSVQRQSFKDIETIVVDNASSDGSIEMLKGYYPEAHLILNTHNLLFCKANNQGIEKSKGDFILCLNNDCFLDKDYLEEAIKPFDIDSCIGIVSGKILRFAQDDPCIRGKNSSRGQITIDSTGLFLGRNRKPVERGYGKRDRGQYAKPGYIFGVSGACAFYRKKMLVDIKDENGYFDERFGMYYEDLDLCWRAQRNGWKSYYTPRAIAYHIRGATAVNNLNGRRRISFLHLRDDDLKRRYLKNRYFCMKKNDTLLGILMNLPFILWYEVRIWIYFLARFGKISLDHCHGA